MSKSSRKQSRELEIREKIKKYDNYDEVFTFNHLYHSAEKCVKGVRWKASTQRYANNMSYNVYKTYLELKENKYKSKGFYEFDLYERGKPRHIKSVHISERVVQHCLCEYSLVPIISRTLIYDNSACLKNKGIDFAVNRLECHLQRYYREHGTEGYILQFDFASFFDNINHEILKEIIVRYYKDERLKALIFTFIDNCGDKGLGLGSQISQICALAYPNKIDHYMKEVMHIKYYGRYMDDGYLIHESKERLQKCLIELRRLCKELDITINEKKTQIIKLSKGFTYLKKRFILLPTGKVIKTIGRKSITKMRRKLKAFKVKSDKGEMQLKDIETSFTSWKGTMGHYSTYKTVQSMTRLYKQLFKKEEKEDGGPRET